MKHVKIEPRNEAYMRFPSNRLVYFARGTDRFACFLLNNLIKVSHCMVDPSWCSRVCCCRRAVDRCGKCPRQAALKPARGVTLRTVPTPLLIADMICLSCCYTPPYNMCMCMTHVAPACLRTPASQHTIVPVCHMILAARSGRARPISRPRSESDVCTLRWRPHIELYTDSGRTR